MVNMKNNMLANLLIGSLVALSIVGCGRMQQDPLDGRENSKKGTEKPTTEQGPKPVPSDFLKIDTVKSFSFEVGRTDEFTVSTRILESDYDVTVVIDNPEMFPNAVYDKATGIFSWNPPADVVPAPAIMQHFDLVLRAVATHKSKPNQAVQTNSIVVPIQVFAKLEGPVIVSSIQNGGSDIIEGNSISASPNLKVVVRDSLATDDKASWPSIVFVNPVGAKNKSLSAYAKVTNVTRLKPSGDFEFTVGFDLTGIELTGASASKYELSFEAISANGVPSAATTVEFKVQNKFEMAQTTWLNKLEAKIGSKVDFTFIYFDPKAEGTVRKPVFSGVPAGALLNCTAGGSVQTCRFEWTVPATTPVGSISITAKVDNAENATSTTVVTSSFNHFIGVIKGTPAPADGGN